MHDFIAGFGHGNFKLCQITINDAHVNSKFTVAYAVCGFFAHDECCHCGGGAWLRENTPPIEPEKTKEVNALTALTPPPKGCACIGIYPGDFRLDGRMMTAQERQREYQQQPPDEEHTVARKAKSLCPLMEKSKIYVGSIECHKCDGYVGVRGTETVICRITE